MVETLLPNTFPLERGCLIFCHYLKTAKQYIFQSTGKAWKFRLGSTLSSPFMHFLFPRKNRIMRESHIRWKKSPKFFNTFCSPLMSINREPFVPSFKYIYVLLDRFRDYDCNASVHKLIGCSRASHCWHAGRSIPPRFVSRLVVLAVLSSFDCILKYFVFEVNFVVF